MSETQFYQYCKTCKKSFASFNAYLVHIESHIEGNEIQPIAGSPRNFIPFSGEPNQVTPSLESRNLSRPSSQEMRHPPKIGYKAQLFHCNDYGPFPYSSTSSKTMPSAEPPNQPIAVNNFTNFHAAIESNIQTSPNLFPPRQQITPVQQQEYSINVDDPSLRTKPYIDQLDKPIEKVIDEEDEAMVGLGEVDVSLRL